jgi:hypothetical protein
LSKLGIRDNPLSKTEQTDGNVEILVNWNRATCTSEYVNIDQYNSLSRSGQ